MRDKKYYQPGYISEWAVINFTNERDIGQIMKGLVDCCQTRGAFSSPKPRQLALRFRRNVSQAWNRRNKGDWDA